MERYKFDAVSRTLIMSADFARAISDVHSAEYKLYKRMLSEIPSLNVERKSHASPTSYKGKNGKRTSYYPTKGLTFERMEQFMKALPEGEKYLEEYNQLRAVALPEEIIVSISTTDTQIFFQGRTQAITQGDCLCFFIFGMAQINDTIRDVQITDFYISYCSRSAAIIYQEIDDYPITIFREFTMTSIRFL